MPKKIATPGLGVMGGGISRIVPEKEFGLIIYNRSGEKTEAPAQSGAQVSESPRHMAGRGDRVGMGRGLGHPDIAVQKGIEARGDMEQL